MNSNTVLYIQVDGNDTLKNKYIQAIDEHNMMVQNSPHPDSGFDLFYPIKEDQETETLSGKLQKLDFYVKTAMFKDSSPIGFYMYPRSSLSKTPLRLANSVGIIDSGYRGKLMGYFDLLEQEYNVTQHQRFLQICSPNLEPFHVYLIDDINSLGQTQRNEGGFGSTGV